MNPDRDSFDPTLDALLREHSSETPSPALDAAILAAAHRAVGSEPAAAAPPERRWRLWMPLAAAAALAAIVVGVAPLSPTAEHDAAPVVSDTPARDAASNVRSAGDAPVPVPASPSAGTAITPPGAAMTDERKAAAPVVAAPASPRRSTEAARNAPVTVPPADTSRAPVPLAPAQKRERDDTEAVDTPLRDDARGTAAARAGAAAGAMRTAPSPSAARGTRFDSYVPGFAQAPAAPAAAAPADDFIAHPHPAAEWIERIERLRKEGNHPAALATLAGFRTAYADADARLPRALRDWLDAPR